MGGLIFYLNKQTEMHESRTNEKKLFYVIRILYILMSVPRLIDEGKKNLKKIG